MRSLLRVHPVRIVVGTAERRVGEASDGLFVAEDGRPVEGRPRITN